MTVVVPPTAAAAVPLPKSSDTWTAPTGRCRWVWASTPPGTTSRPGTSTTSVAGSSPGTDDRSGPTAVMRPSAPTSTSAGRSPSTSTTDPPRTSITLPSQADRPAPGRLSPRAHAARWPSTRKLTRIALRERRCTHPTRRCRGRAGHGPVAHGAGRWHRPDGRRELRAGPPGRRAEPAAGAGAARLARRRRGRRRRGGPGGRDQLHDPARSRARRPAAGAGPAVAPGGQPPDPQHRHHRRQPRHRLAGGRHASGPGGARRHGRAGLDVGAPGHAGGRVRDRAQVDGAGAGRAGGGGSCPGRPRPPGVPQDRRAQRHGHRRGQLRTGPRPRPPAAGLRARRSGPRPDPRPRRRGLGHDPPRLGRPPRPRPDGGRRLRPPHGRGQPAHRRPPGNRRLPASRRRGAGPPGAGAGVGCDVTTTPPLPAEPAPDADAPAAYELTVNGVAHAVEGARPTDSLLHVLRDRLGLPGAKNACEQGECGSCSVLVDGVLVCACLELAEAAVGCEITTVEGLTPAGAEPGDAALTSAVLTDVQRAMVEAGGVQCGFCTPGFVVAIHDLLDRVPEPTRLEVREALAGNLCRCTGYGRILAAVDQVVAVRSGHNGD